MPYTIIIDNDLGCCFTRWTGGGPELLDEVPAFYRELTARTDLAPGLNWFHDVRDSDLNVSTEATKLLVSYLGKGSTRPGEKRRIVFLAASDLNFGMIRMFGLLSELPGVDINVTHERTRAMEWLGLPADFDDPFEDDRRP